MDGLNRHSRSDRIQSLRYPAVLDNNVKTLLNRSVMIASFLRYYSGKLSDQLPETYFDALLTDWRDGMTIAEKYHAGLSEGETEPSWSVLINFIENLNKTAEQFNLRWQEYPEWYLRSVLGVQPLPVIGDKVWVVFENNGQEPVVIPENTRFKVSREKNKTYYYQLTEEAEVHNVRLEKLFLLHFNKDKRPATDSPFIKSIRLNELELQNDQITTYKNKDTTIGIRISSPLLVLREGVRTVKVTFYPRNDQWNDQVSENSTLTSAFKLYISTETGWEHIPEYMVKKERGKLKVLFTLPDSFPALTPCSYEVHSFQSAYPALNVCLNLDSDDYVNASLEMIQLSHIKLRSEVKNVTNLQIYNELGKIDNSKPFVPFGMTTERGAWFTVGNYEINIKPTKTVTLNFEWEQLPEHPSGLKGHYSDYQKNIANHSFELAVNYLSDFQWKPVRGRTKFPLFASEKGTDLLATTSSIGPIDVEKMATITIDEQEYNYSLQSRNGFLNFSLSNPEMGFGESVYRRIFTEQMLKNARKKNKYPSIQPPVQPVLKRISLNYEAEEIIDIRTHSDESRSSVSAIIPLDEIAVSGHDVPETVSFIPEMQERNLLLALSNVQENMLLTLFFDVYANEHEDLQQDSIRRQREKIRHVRLYIGNPHYWERMPLSFTRKDETIALLISGCMQMQLPETLSPQLFDSNGLLWIRIGYNDVDDVNFPDIKAVYTNAAQLEMILPEYEQEDLIVNCETGDLTEDVLIPGLNKIRRITPFYDGRSGEDAHKKLMRMAEYAAHKGRAVTPRDYERLIIQAFPEIAKAKCIVNRKGSDATLHIVVLPEKNMADRKIHPLTPPHLLFNIERYIRNLASSYVKEITILNPVYEEIIIRCRIELKGYFSVKRRKLLAQRINEFIAPWRYMDQLPLFGYAVNLEKMHDAIIKEFGTLISISDFSAIRIEKNNGEFMLHDFICKKSGVFYENYVIHPSEAHGVLVPSDNHIFYWDNDIIPDEFGIEEMSIGKNFIISNKKKHK
ncbi:hypothetical protein G5B10_12345 [Fluviicola sp. SGL-29]|nr:hypothetical protein [Fluviicola sp. SGL-29]